MGTPYPIEKGYNVFFTSNQGHINQLSMIGLYFGRVGPPIFPQKWRYLTKPQYSYKQASISCFVNHGPQMLTASVLMVLFEPLGHVCDPRYLKPTILAFFGSPRLAQNGHFGLFCYYSQNIGFWVPQILQLSVRMCSSDLFRVISIS